MDSISILLADDDVIIRQCVRRAVEWDSRLRIRWEADNGLQALCLARRYQPHVILMDAEMPRMSGLEATRCLRQNDSKIRIVVMSVLEENRSAALAAGADDFIMKDGGCAEIRDAVYRVMNLNCNRN